MTDAVPPHLVPFAGGWASWRWIRLRGAGFPARLVDELAMPGALRAVDAYLAATHAADIERERAIEALAERLPASDRAERRALARTLKRLRNRALDVPGEMPHESALAQLRATAAIASDRLADVRSAFEAGRREASRATRRVLANERFREAITWQNRHALGYGLRKLLEIPIDAVDKETRNREQVVASYLQRYCVKNDTIGFFGPVGWATLSDQPGIVVTPGTELVATRNVYFEYWGIAALAQRIADVPGVLPWLTPRRSPGVRIDDLVRDSSLEPGSAVAGQLIALLTACDGERRAIEIFGDLASRVELGFDGIDDVHALLGELAEQGGVLWTLEVPPEELYPERHLRRELEAIGDAETCRTALAMLDALEEKRAAVAGAAGDANALDAALAMFDRTFTELTGREPTRKHGETYGGRTLLYEDCQRDLACEIGTDVLVGAGPALELLLTGARWYTYTIARRYRDAVRPIYEALRTQKGSAVIELAPFWSEVRTLLADDNPQSSIVATVTDELHARWRRILELDLDARCQQRQAAELAPLVAEQFRAPGPGWPLARYHSPDLMIAARSLDAVRRGDHVFVVGEVHTGINSVFVPVFVKEFTDRAALTRARVADIPVPGIAPVWSHGRSRADVFSMAPHDYALENGTTRSWRPRGQVIAASDLVVELIDDILYVRTRDSAVRFDIIAFLEHHLIAASHSRFTVLGDVPHAPRVTVDNVVLSRERWRFAAPDIDFARRATPLDRFVEARRWTSALGLPRRVFIKVPDETKPMYVDFESSLLVDNMARIVRRATHVTISEMLPSVDETWLPDAQRQEYTSELRLVVVDPLAYAPEA